MDHPIPEGYRPLLDPKETEAAVHTIKEAFEAQLSAALNLQRVSAPLFVQGGLGINDDLNGTERPVRFPIKAMGDQQAEVVHSLAKWKRLTLADRGFSRGTGIYTDMQAIRADETLDNVHSLSVDQWDWEKVIRPMDRDLCYLKHVVRVIYEQVRRVEREVAATFPGVDPILPDEVTFVHAETLQGRYPELSPFERETAVCRKWGAVFVIGIGGVLADGRPHDGRAPDYDDWTTPTGPGTRGLNGDLLVFFPTLDRALELSSMGIRVDGKALARQLEIAGCEERMGLEFHRRLGADDLPTTIGGGIGQSRLCMFLLRKAHIGEVQASVWPDAVVDEWRGHHVTFF